MRPTAFWREAGDGVPVVCLHANASSSAQWLEMPVLYMTGERSPASALAVARLLTAVLPRVQVVKFCDLGHMGPLTHPLVVNGAIESFLRRTLARQVAISS